MKLTPIGDRIVVRPVKAGEVKQGGLYLPQTIQEGCDQGVVVEAGAGALSLFGVPMPLSVHVDDTVLYGKFPFTEVSVDGETLLVMRESDVIAVVGN